MGEGLVFCCHCWYVLSRVATIESCEWRRVGCGAGLFYTRWGLDICISAQMTPIGVSGGGFRIRSYMTESNPNAPPA